jgi:hypothetical protein
MKNTKNIETPAFIGCKVVNHFTGKTGTIYGIQNGPNALVFLNMKDGTGSAPINELRHSPRCDNPLHIVSNK